MRDTVRPQGSFQLSSPGAAAYNLREAGGFATTSGARLQTGRLFRSGQLETAGTDLAGVLAALRIGTIIDMRTDSERHTPRGAAFDGFAGRVLSPDCEDNTIPHAVDAFRGLTSNDQVKAHYCSIYRKLPEGPRFRQAAQHYVTAVQEASETEDEAVLIHCFAGKDRTGLAVALLHLTLGVHEDDVYANYLQTNEMGAERVEVCMTALLGNRQSRLPEWMIAEAMAVRPEYLANALEVIDQNYGSAAKYLAHLSGMELTGIEQMAERLTV